MKKKIEKRKHKTTKLCTYIQRLAKKKNKSIRTNKVIDKEEKKMHDKRDEEPFLERRISHILVKQ